MVNFKKYFLTENIYRDNTGKLVYRFSPQEQSSLGKYLSSNEQLVAKEIFLDTTVRGNMSTFIPSKHGRLFIGYDVYTTSKAEDKELRNSIYAAIKGTSNLLKGNEYVKEFQALPKEDYDMIVERGVAAFINTVKVPYDYILFPDSRSSHVQDISELVDSKIKQKFTEGPYGQRAQQATVQMIPKKPITPETIKQVVYIDKLAQHALESIEKKANIQLPQQARTEVFTFLKESIVEFLLNKIKNVKDGEKFSTGTHTRSVSNKEIFAKAISILNENVPELENKLSNIEISGHLDQFCDSHLELDELKAQLAQYEKNKKSTQSKIKTRILIVDDNINSGDMYKQVAPLGDTLLFCDFFFLMKDMRYKV